VKLDAQLREEIGSQKVKVVLREQDMIPGIIYGGKKPPTVIKIDRRSYEKIRREHHGEVVFHLNILEGEKKLRDYSAVVKEEQHDFVTHQIVHVDFKRISLKEKIEVRIPLAAKGEPIGVKKEGGSLDHVLWELDAVCLPTDIPEEIKIDVSALNIGDSIHVKDIQLPEGVVTKHDPEAMIFSVVPPMREEEPVEADEDVEPELIKKEKEEGASEDEGVQTEAESPEKAEAKE